MSSLDQRYGKFQDVRIILTEQGVKKIHGVGKVNEYEQGLIDACVKDLAGNIKKGVAFGE